MKEALKQTDTDLYEPIQKIGCFFRAAARMAEYAAAVEGKKRVFLTAQEINNLWDEAKKIGYLDANDNLNNSVAVANAALKVLDVKGRFTEVATFQNGVMNWYKALNLKERRADYYIQKILQNGPNRTHFVNVTKYGEVIWDPHEPPIKSQGTVYTICYRYDGEPVKAKATLEKMKQELVELEDRIHRNKIFINSDDYKRLRTYKQDVLRMQNNAMEFYALALRKRIEFEEEK